MNQHLKTGILGILKYFAGIALLCVFLLIWALVVLAEGVVGCVRVVREALRV